MFRSYRYVCLDARSKQYDLCILDSDFITLVPFDLTLREDVEIAKEYARRNLLVGKNMALYCLYKEKDGRNINNIIADQDWYCSKHIGNWVRIAAERNRLLEKLSAMK